MKFFPCLVAVACAFVSCSPAPSGSETLKNAFPGESNSRRVAAMTVQPVGLEGLSRRSLERRVNLIRDLIPRGTHARKTIRPMRPRFITIHSTQNFSEGADALRHSLALKRGKLRSGKRPGGNRIGYLVWHFSVDQRQAVQHLPTSEQGEHADYDGPGNNLSIGIEMCENRGNSRTATIERTALLCAMMMKEHRIPLQNVVPHHHWPRWDKTPAHKNCPHYLLEDGKPGSKWRWFQSKVKVYYDALS